MKWYLIVILIFIFLMINDVKYLFMCLFAIFLPVIYICLSSVYYDVCYTHYHYHNSITPGDYCA